MGWSWWMLVALAAAAAADDTTTVAAATNEETQQEKCATEAASVQTPMILLAAVPPAVNAVTMALLVLLIFRIRAIRTANDEVFQSTMLLTRTALRVTIPRRAVESIQKVVGDPKEALKTRLSKTNAEKQKKTN